MVARALGPEREAMADVNGVTITRYPPGLLAALEKIEADGTAFRPRSRTIDHLWLQAPETVGVHRPPFDEEPVPEFEGAPLPAPILEHEDVHPTRLLDTDHGADPTALRILEHHAEFDRNIREDFGNRGQMRAEARICQNKPTDRFSPAPGTR